MQVALISRDDRLKDLCCEALEALPGRCAGLLAVAPGAPLPAADVFIWDDHQDAPALVRFPDAVHVLLATRDRAAALLDQAPPGSVTMILKPVDAGALRALLERRAGYCDAAAALRRDRDAILESLLEATGRLQECERGRMHFLARAVHDFRTPLTAVNGYCGMLSSGALGPLTVAQEEVLERTLHSIRRLNRLASALFQWSSGTRAELQHRVQDADFEECCRQALREVQTLAGEKNIAVQLDLRPPETPLHFDPARIEQLLVTLLENSCKFTPRGGSISVRAFSCFWERRSADVFRTGCSVERRRRPSQRANAYRIEISDSGMEIRPGHMQSIFEEYSSYGGETDRAGSGLGLAICKRIVAEHGGRIFAESGHPGVTFVCLLPFLHAAFVESGERERAGIHLVAQESGGGQA